MTMWENLAFEKSKGRVDGDPDPLSLSLSLVDYTPARTMYICMHRSNKLSRPVKRMNANA